MGLILHHLFIGAFSWFIAYVFTTNMDHNLFLKQIHYQELGIQIQHMHEKLYEHCPNDFQTPNSASIIGRRRFVDTSLDLKIELAEKTLDYLILKFSNCTGTNMLQTTTRRLRGWCVETYSGLYCLPVFTLDLPYMHEYNYTGVAQYF